MDEFDDRDALIAALYQGVLAPQDWAETFRRIATGLGAHAFHFLVWDRRVGTQVYGLTTEDLGAEPIVEYGDYYGRLDPAVGLLERAEPGQLFLTQTMFDERYVDRDEFHQDFLRKWDVRNRIVGCLHRADDLEYYVGLLRAPRHGRFDDTEIRGLHSLLPHLQGSARLFHRTARLREVAALGTEAFNLLDYGVLTLDRKGRVLFANQQALAMLRQGDTLVLREQCLRAVGYDDQRRLEAARVLVSARGHPRALSVRRQDDARSGSLYVTLARLPGVQTALPVTESAEILVLVHDPRLKRILSAPQLMQLFHLSVAEARVVEDLARGSSLEDIAAAHGVRISTARTQLRGALHKTGCKRQQDLVRLVVGIQAVPPVGE